ncbi:MAG TPA: phosphotransferase [Terriglobales bacterium]|nr:phosphotransferase [Terriglobales bacterium]
MSFTLKQFDLAKENVAAALDVGPSHIEVHRYELSPEKRSTRVWGSALGKGFFAKTLLTEPYQVTPRISTPWDESRASAPTMRPIGEQIEIEWSTTFQLRRLLDPNNLPEPVGRSLATKTIVWGDVHGLSLNELVKRPRIWGTGSPVLAKGMSAAGSWLRCLHERSMSGRSVILDLGEMRQGLQARMRQSGLMSFPYAKRALQALDAAISEIGRTVFEAPGVLSHGDFMLTNLLWNASSGTLFVVDFENFGPSSVCQDLLSLVFDFRSQLLNPLIPRKLILGLERAFWEGYGPVAKEVKAFVNGVASSRVFYYHLPRVLSTRKEQGGWAAATASVYETFFQSSMLARCLQI